jgi:hypothetical protein
MIWVAWRQQRAQLLLSGALIAAVAAVMVYFRFAAVDYLHARGLDGCRMVDPGRCTPPAMSAFAEAFGAYTSALPMVLLCLPVLVGMFAGAPLFAREFEQGTHVFALSQSVPRGRWLWMKLLVSGAPVVLAMLALGLVGTWSLRPLSFVAHGRMMTPGFETQGPVLAAYTAAALAIGAAVGILFRNTVTAMAATIGLYVVLLWAVGGLTRGHLLQPVERSGTVAAGAEVGSQDGRSVVPDDAWWVGSSYYDASGGEVHFDPSSCRQSDTGIQMCLGRQGITSLRATFHPDSQFWSMQYIEAGEFAVLTSVLLSIGAWRLRRRPL